MISQNKKMSNKKISKNRPLVYVAMSGGVDSSVAAALLKRRGLNIVGVFMKPWQPKIENFCLWKEDREDALRAASVLGIPLLTWDFSKQYKKAVINYMIREYKAGRTPNPDVMCNREIKFGIFFDKAIEEGADFIATGHYIRLEPEYQIFKPKFLKKSLKIKNCKLKIARDSAKDQSYFLWTLKQKQLKKCLFPIGEHTKPEVRKLAKKFGLPNYAKKDSQGVCFIGPLDMKDFLKTRIKSKPGKIIHLNGKVLGNHDGAYYYTIGQRHGLNIGIGGGPYYVVKKDIKKNIVYVGNERDLYSKELKVSNISWVNDVWKLNFQTGHLEYIRVKIRYRSQTEKAILSKKGILKFSKPVRAITSGQSAVFYKGKELIGGGIIS